MSTPRRSVPRRAFSLVEAALSVLIVATMFAAGMAASGAAARDRRTQTSMVTGQQLARVLIAEIVQQRYADPSPNTITPFTGISITDRSTWNHIDDYTNFSESPPRDRSGVAIAGATGWKWTASVAYTSFPTFSGAGGTAATGTGVGGLLGGVLGAVGSLLGAAATDTGLKKIIVTVTDPSGKPTTLTAMRSTNGAVDRPSTAPGFHAWTQMNLTVGRESTPVQTGAPLLNTPPIP